MPTNQEINQDQTGAIVNELQRDAFFYGLLTLWSSLNNLTQQVRLSQTNIEKSPILSDLEKSELNSAIVRISQQLTSPTLIQAALDIERLLATHYGKHWSTGTVKAVEKSAPDPESAELQRKIELLHQCLVAVDRYIELRTYLKTLSVAVADAFPRPNETPWAYNFSTEQQLYDALETMSTSMLSEMGKVLDAIPELVVTLTKQLEESAQRS